MNETEGNVQCLPKISMTHDVCVCVGDEIKASYRLKLTLAAGFFSVFGVFFFENLVSQSDISKHIHC